MIHPVLFSLFVLVGPPETRVQPVTETVHGEVIVDDYRWLEALDAESEEVKAWTTAQNEYTRGVLEGLDGREKIEQRLGELLSVGNVDAPQMRGGLYFHTERLANQNQPVLFVREGLKGEPRRLLDVNALDDRGLTALDWYVPSPDGRLVAIGLSHAGDEMTVLHLLDTRTGTWLADELSGKIDFAGWAPRGDGFLYGVLENPADAYSRAFKYHVVGRHHRQDPLLFRQDAPSRIPGAMLSRDGRWIVKIIFEGWSKQEVSVIDATAWLRDGRAAEAPVAVGYEARFEPQFIRGDHLYMLTTLDAPNGALYAVDLSNPQRDQWTLVVPERADAVLDLASEAKNVLVAQWTVNASNRLERLGWDGRSHGEVPLPGLGTAAISTHHDRDEAFVTYMSFNEPQTIYRTDLGAGQGAGLAMWARPDVPLDPSILEVHQEWCVSKDGTRVPMFIVHRKGLERTGRTPTLVYGYGGFNQSIAPRFSPRWFVWLEQGGIFVSVTLRGGGEFGEAWHQAGMLAKKQNVYDDLYAATEYLIGQKYTSPDHLAVIGGSNGGLLTGVAATQRPDLYAAAVSLVPLLDMVRYPGFLMARFWIPEYGDPADSEAFRWLKSYSPYHNVREGQKYPAMLITAGENDNRVHPMHARKMAAVMQARAANDLDKDPVLLWVDREAGHGQGKPIALQIHEIADILSFCAWQTGLSAD